jgi:neutral ceramidase
MIRYLVLLLFCVSAPSALLAQAKPSLRAGAFAIDVSPQHFPISVNGGFADRKLTKLNDPLHARCLVLDDGKTKLAIVVVDSCMLPRKLLDEAKKLAEAKTGILAKNMLVSATHTHSAPTAGPAFQSEPDAKYVEFLTGKIAEGIEKAHSLLQPAELGYGSVDEPRELFNRRWFTKPGAMNLDPFGNTTDQVRMNPGHENPSITKPAGPVDPQVFVLSVRTREGRPLALLANYSLHYVGDLPNVSADYFGVFSERIGSLIGADEKSPKFMAALSNGTSGDVNNINFGSPALKFEKPGDRCRKVAETVAQAAAKAYRGIQHRSDITLAVEQEELSLGVRKANPDELEKAKKQLSRMYGPGEQLKTSAEVFAREALLLDKYPDKVQTTVQSLKLGDLAIVGLPMEVFTEIGLTIKKQSPVKNTFTISLANGHFGYLPTPAQHKLGGYETWRARSSYLEVEASEKIVSVLLKQLERLR